MLVRRLGWIALPWRSWASFILEDLWMSMRSERTRSEHAQHAPISTFVDDETEGRGGVWCIVLTSGTLPRLRSDPTLPHSGPRSRASCRDVAETDPSKPRIESTAGRAQEEPDAMARRVNTDKRNPGKLSGVASYVEVGGRREETERRAEKSGNYGCKRPMSSRHKQRTSCL